MEATKEQVMNTRHRWQRPIYVTLSCTGEQMDESEVKATNIEEDFEGRDVLTFICPVCKQEHRSLRRG